MRVLQINTFSREVSVSFRNEQYLVRDNGAICRIHRPGERKRRLDGVWTFGRPCGNHGYMRSAGFVVHKIVATAFYGDQPSQGHVVDHIDTDRINNHIENLRWVTRLENIANNPKTLRRIEKKWGSLEGMLQDPDRADKADPLNNRSRMPKKINEIAKEETDTFSFTPLAMQRNWRTPNAFPLCPEKITDQPLKDYFEQLTKGSIFSHNRYGEAVVEMAHFSKDGLSISVLNRLVDGVKDWGVSKITFEEGRFVHAAYGSFFSIEGAEKRHCELVGKPWDGGDSIDDYC